MEKSNIKNVVNKVYKMCGNEELFVKVFISACVVFIAIMQCFALSTTKIDGKGWGEVANIFPAYYLMLCSPKYNIRQRNTIFSCIPITRRDVDKCVFRYDLVTYVIWLLVVISHNILYFLNEELYKARGVFGIAVVLTAVAFVAAYVGEYVANEKNRNWIMIIPPIVIIVCVLVCFAGLFGTISDNMIAVLELLNKTVGILAGTGAIILATVVSSGIIIHFCTIQVKKEGAWY